MPFVVVITSVEPLRRVEELARRVAEVEALDEDVVPLARERDPVGRERACVLDLGDAHDALVARRERLAHRRRRAQHVDRDPEVARDLLGWGEADANPHYELLSIRHARDVVVSSRPWRHGSGGRSRALPGGRPRAGHPAGAQKEGSWEPWVPPR